MDRIEYRWLDGQEMVDLLNPILLAEGQEYLLTAGTCRAYCAFDGPDLIGYSVFQLIPMLGPHWVAPKDRTFTVSQALADEIIAFMDKVQARGYLAIAANEASARLCRMHGMELVTKPVYRYLEAS